MDFIFYIIFNSYFKDGHYKNDIPPLTVGGIFTILFFCIILLIQGIYEYFQFGNIAVRSFGKIYAILIGWICAGLVYFVFYYNKRYIKIYNRFKDDKFANSWIGGIFGWGLLALLMLSPFMFVLVRKNFL
jgi:uncharacterized membrane-anchored protein